MLQINRIDAGQARRHEGELARLLHENYRIGFPDSDVELAYAAEKIRGLVRYLETNDAVVYGALDDGRLLGFLWGVRRMILSTPRFHINELIVAADCRGQGIGRRLVDAFVEDAARNGVDTVDLFCSKTNAGGVAFYESLGFEIERYQMRLTRRASDGQAGQT